MILLIIYTCLLYSILRTLSFESENLQFNYFFSGEDWPSDFQNCAGFRQSPINLSLKQNGNNDFSFKMRLRSNDKIITHEIKNSVKTEGLFSKLSFGQISKNNNEYESNGFHFHCPSEHAINGIFGDAEMHLVHQINDENEGFRGTRLAVFGIIFKVVEGKQSGFFNNWKMNTFEEPVLFNFEKAFREIIATGKGYYRYSGSLTTPPCSEGVDWFVLDEMIDLSVHQLSVLKRLYAENPAFAFGNGNNRLLQEINGRMVFYQPFNNINLFGPSFVVNSMLRNVCWIKLLFCMFFLKP